MRDASRAAKYTQAAPQSAANPPIQAATGLPSQRAHPRTRMPHSKACVSGNERQPNASSNAWVGSPGNAVRLKVVP